jgi:hypothetical protein
VLTLAQPEKSAGDRRPDIRTQGRDGYERAVAEEQKGLQTQGSVVVLSDCRYLDIELGGSSSFQNCGNGSCQDLKVEPQRPMLDVLHVEMHPMVERNRAPTVDLP